MLASEMIRRGAIYHGPKTAVMFGDQRMTFTEVDLLSNRIANVLIDTLKLEVGRRVGLLLNNSIYTLPLDFGFVKSRLSRVPLNSRLSLVEQQQMLEGAGVDTLIHGTDLTDRAQEIAGTMQGLKLISIGHASDPNDLLQLAQGASNALPSRRPEPDDVVITIFTSGTTGKLKAVEHTQASWGAMATNVLINMEVGEGDVMLHAASMIHASGCFIVPYWLRGGVAAVLPGFTPASYLDAVERWKPTALNLVPTMIGMLLDHPGIEQADFSSVKSIIYGASPMPRPVMLRALKQWGPRFAQYYGQSEAPIFITHLTKADHVGPNAEQRLASCGRPSIDCEIKLVNEDGDEVAAGEAGEIALRTPFAMKGYYNAPELNAQMFLPDGWLRTRDVGRFDADGYLYLVDRTSDMIVTGGYNVYPREVEDALAAHPAVREVVIVGLPDDKWGESVAAFVALRKDASAEEAELIAFARDRVASYKVPKQVRFIDEVPKSPVGKLLRRAVRDPFWQGRERKI
ncbi:long-chain fatty acid--CoA ligase [Rhodopseudomonas sp. AAP120]|uniref:class I adenylate-forming enzyme family protein n=1 Tax=Rhodopseudomonas sp. AAP120 TaxID=1523430 RepID=UPI0006B89A54|nr:AMP-binding protein [Rhodopseudomonas sp. AAP120]KPF95631.1 long-chain fatty acid--CoA ligase [Rhodopseudomonas sp. AAP120]